MGGDDPIVRLTSHCRFSPIALSESPLERRAMVG